MLRPPDFAAVVDAEIAEEGQQLPESCPMLMVTSRLRATDEHKRAQLRQQSAPLRTFRT